jgi:hypothetical protein
MGATGPTGAARETGAPGVTGVTGGTGSSRADGFDPSKPIDVTKLAPILAHGQRVEKLTSEQQGRFNELMATAEEQLRQGEYMNAELRFQRALRFMPGHPLAMGGIANAQLGAELYLSAADTLRVLYTDHPEMIDVAWAEGLLPSQDRLKGAVATLRTSLEGPRDRASFALVLAYVGRQLNDRATVAEGLAHMAKESPDDPLPPLLQAVWLNPGSGADSATQPEK